MYQCNKIEQDFTKQRPILEIDSLLDSGATLNLLNEDNWNEIKYNNPDILLEQDNKTLTAANNTTIETLGTVTLNLTPDKTSNSRNKPQHNFSIHFYVTQCNHNILGTPFFKEYIETINVNTNKLTLNTNTIMDNDITFFMNSTKGYPYYSRLYPIFNKEPLYLERDQHKCKIFPIPIFKQMEKSNGKTIYKSMYYFEPINKYQNLSFTDIKDLSIEKEHFIDIFLINKNQHKETINVGQTGFIYQNITFKQNKEEMYHTNSIDLFSALYHLTYEQLSTGKTFTNPVIILRKGESLKIVLDARYLNSMIDESKCNWPIEPVDVALTRINGTIFTTADLNSAYNQITFDEQSMRYTHFTIGNKQYCFKRLFYGISIGPAAFASILTHFLYPLIRKGTVITYVDDIFIQTNPYPQMYETRIEYHKILLKENLKAAPDKTYFMLKKLKFLGHIIEDKKIKPLTSRIDGFQKLEPPTSMKALQRYLGTINFLAKYVYGMQPILKPLYNLLHKENEFKWTKELQQIFEQMKRTITHKLELTMPDTTKPFYIITDASNTGIGAAL